MYQLSSLTVFDNGHGDQKIFNFFIILSSQPATTSHTKRLLRSSPSSSQSGQVIENQTQIKEIFRDIEGASQIIAESPQFDQDTAKSLMEVKIMMVMLMMMRGHMRLLRIAPSLMKMRRCHFKSL